MSNKSPQFSLTALTFGLNHRDRDTEETDEYKSGTAPPFVPEQVAERYGFDFLYEDPKNARRQTPPL
jgi:hypothetical protein